MSLLVLGACSSEPFEEADEGQDGAEARSCRIPTYEKRVDETKRSSALEAIRRGAAAEGIPNAALLLAGVGAHETGLVQCWKDNRTHCQGPYSATCKGPVLAGSSDGPCDAQEGGLGMFQFDSGNHAQTLRAYGKDILTESGNARVAARLIVSKLQVCPLGPRPTSPEEAKRWLDGVRVGTPDYDAFLDVMARCYNGAGERSCRFKQVRAGYDAQIRFLARDGGDGYWYGRPVQTASAEELTPADGDVVSL